MRRLFPYSAAIVGIACTVLASGDAAAAEQNPAPDLGKTRAVRLLDSPPSGATPDLVPAPSTPPEADPSAPPAQIEDPASPSAATPETGADSAAQRRDTAAPAQAPSNPSEDTPGFVVMPTPPAIAGEVKLANAADVAIELVAGDSLSIGSRVSFRVTSKKSGYLILIDIDPEGRMLQIYPNPLMALRSFPPKGNFIKANAPTTIPSATDTLSGLAYVVAPPTGWALVVAVLSERPVQVIDLPELANDQRGPTSALQFLAKSAAELRIPERETGELREAKWSFNAKSYLIR